MEAPQHICHPKSDGTFRWNFLRDHTLTYATRTNTTLNFTYNVWREIMQFQIPSMLQGVSLTRLLQGAAFGAIAATFVGFYSGYWVLSSAAQKMAADRSDHAVVTALAPVCADKFRAQPEADAKRAALRKVGFVEAKRRVSQGVGDPAGRILRQLGPRRSMLEDAARPEIRRTVADRRDTFRV